MLQRSYLIHLALSWKKMLSAKNALLQKKIIGRSPKIEIELLQLYPGANPTYDRELRSQRCKKLPRHE
jgi:hypothetical protein